VPSASARPAARRRTRRIPKLRHTTAGGLVFVGAVLMVAVVAAISANNLVFLILAAMLATLMISNLIGRLSLAGLELDFRLPEHVSARRQFPARVLVRNAKRWMPSFSVRLNGAGGSVFSAPLYFPLIPGGATLDEVVGVEFARRGIHREEGFQFSTAFPFGFLERRAPVSLRRELLVYPCLSPQPGFENLLGTLAGEVSAHYRGTGHDFYRIRPYEALESARHVDWKATAHTGALQVREFAREEEPLVEILFDLNVPEEHLGWFEHAVECCAFLAWRLTEREARVRFVTQDYAITAPATGDIHTILKYLAQVAPRHTSMLPARAGEGGVPLVFTAVPERFHGEAWDQAHIVGPKDLIPPPAK
jgi:uncharacterized protein (DUF58 family)